MSWHTQSVDPLILPGRHGSKLRFLIIEIGGRPSGMPRFLTISAFLLIAATLRAEEDSSIPSVFQRYCVKCHGQDGKVKGEVNLLEIESLTALTANQDLLNSLIEAIDFAEMPPEDELQPPAEERASLLATLVELRRESAARNHAIAHTPIRRMNRFQYDNAVVDLFGLKGVVFSLPERMMREHGNYFRPETGKMADTVKVGSRPLGKSQMIERRLGGVAPFPQDLRAEHGFDNRGDHLSLSPLLMESFLKLGQSVVESDDFNEDSVGIWAEFFADPEAPFEFEFEFELGLELELEAKAEARARLRWFLTRAFRRPIEDSLLDRYSGFVAGQLDSGSSFTEAMKATAAAVISSPKFLYLYDGASSADGVEAIDDLELASRLSFLLTARLFCRWPTANSVWSHERKAAVR